MPGRQFDTADAPDAVWLGDLAGFEIQADGADGLRLAHRCGWSAPVHAADRYLANLVTLAVEERARHDCRSFTGY